MPLARDHPLDHPSSDLSLPTPQDLEIIASSARGHGHHPLSPAATPPLTVPSSPKDDGTKRRRPLSLPQTGVISFDSALGHSLDGSSVDFTSGLSEASLAGSPALISASLSSLSASVAAAGSATSSSSSSSSSSSPSLSSAGTGSDFDLPHVQWAAILSRRGKRGRPTDEELTLFSKGANQMADFPPFASMVPASAEPKSPPKDRERRKRPTSMNTRNEPNPKITSCEHKLREHYAKGYCYYCYEHYRSTGTDTRTVPNPKISNCPHTTREHHARGMCSSCYERHRGPKRAEKATYTLTSPNPKITACEHVLKEHQAKGYCHQCYRSVQNKRRREKNKSLSAVDIQLLNFSSSSLPPVSVDGLFVPHHHHPLPHPHSHTHMPIPLHPLVHHPHSLPSQHLHHLQYEAGGELLHQIVDYPSSLSNNIAQRDGGPDLYSLPSSSSSSSAEIIRSDLSESSHRSRSLHHPDNTSQ